MYNIDTCAICRETLETSETRVLPCSHPYHKECINSWLARVPSCPYCRTMVVIEDVTPVDTDSEQEAESDDEESDEELIPEPRPLPEDDIVPWIRASTDGDVTREEMERFMCVVRHNPNFRRIDVLVVIYNFCRFHNFDAHLLPDDDIVPWYYVSTYGVLPEPVMDRFMRVLRHGFDANDVRIVLYNALYRQLRYRYSPDLRQLIQRAYRGIQ